MQTMTLGRTGLEVSRLGVGLAEIGLDQTFSEVAQAGQVLNSALDAGINFLDTAACYDISEELIGRTIAHRRDEYYLVTKCGHVAGGYSGRDWDPQLVRDSIDRSLTRMKTDYVDLMQLHGCDVEVLEQGEVIEVLLDAQRAGKTRFVGYSGDNEAARWAVDSGLFDTLQTSFNLVEQHARSKLFAQAEAKGMGIIIKRPIANGAWGVARSPSAYADEYFRRAQIIAGMGPISGAPEDRIHFTMGFVFAHPEVDTAIVGTRNPSHMMSNIELFERGVSIPAETIDELYRRFDMVGDQWLQLE